MGYTIRKNARAGIICVHVNIKTHYYYLLNFLQVFECFVYREYMAEWFLHDFLVKLAFIKKDYGLELNKYNRMESLEKN